MKKSCCFFCVRKPFVCLFFHFSIPTAPSVVRANFEIRASKVCLSTLGAQNVIAVGQEALDEPQRERVNCVRLCVCVCVCVRERERENLVTIGIFRVECSVTKI